MSDTPRTDEREKAAEDVTTYCIDGWAFARKLERELKHWEQRAYGAEDELKTLRDAAPDAGATSGREVPAAAPVAAPPDWGPYDMFFLAFQTWRGK